MKVLDPSGVLAALEATGRAFVCLIFDVEVAPGEKADLRDPSMVALTNVAETRHQAVLLRRGADYLDRELHRGIEKTSN